MKRRISNIALGESPNLVNRICKGYDVAVELT